MTSLLQQIYYSMPVWVQNIAISIFGLKWNQRRFGGVFSTELKAFKERESFSHADWDNYQTLQLRKMLIHAYENVPYYHTLLNGQNLTAQNLKKITLEDLHKIPILEKKHLRLHGKGSLLSKVLEKKGEFYASSGSTGTPTQILFSAPMHQRWSAVFEARIRNWAGLTIRDGRGMIGGRRIIKDAENHGPYYRYNYVEKQVYFSAYHISAHTASNYVNGMKRHQIRYMTGYAMSNYFLARFIKENGLQAPQLKAVITSSEKLTPEMRQLFKEVYGCKTYDSYSGLEACGLISECEYGSLHISPDVGIIELIKENGEKAMPGEKGEAVCTGFLNFDQPLIRYRIGDIVKLSINQQCKCGRHMPVVDEIIGRLEDTVVGKDGREMVRFHGIFVDLPNIIEGQIIQHSLDLFEIVVVPVKTLSQSEKEIMQKRMESQLGTIHVQFTETSFIPRNRNGKFQAVISHIER